MQRTKQIIRELIVRIDSMVKQQLITILANKTFQDFVSNWSCLNFLIKCSDKDTVKIKLLNLKLEEISASIDGEIDFRGALSQKLFDEFDLPGNPPLSVIIGSYNFNLLDKKNVDILAYFGEIASYIFSPFVTTITPESLGVQEFSQLYKVKLDSIMDKPQFKNLLEIAKNDYANFLSLVVPKVLYKSIINYTYNDLGPSKILSHNFHEQEYLFGNAAYMLTAFIMNSFKDTGWFLETIGIPTKNLHTSGMKNYSLTSNRFFQGHFDKIEYIFYKYMTDCLISENVEKALAELGFISLCQVMNRDFAVFYSSNTLKNLYFTRNQDYLLNPPYELQYILCVSRFAHFIKIIGRQKIGSYTNPHDLEDFLNKWFLQYVSSNKEIPLSLKYKYPLLDAKVEVSEDSLLQDYYICKIYLKPHSLSAQLSANIILKTKFHLPNLRK